MNKRRLVRTANGTFFIDPVSLLGTTILESEFEPLMAEVLRRYLPSGGVFIDMGANEGYFSVLASKLVGPAGAVIAIEPQSRLQGVVLTNFAENECFNVRLFKCVVSDKTGRARLSIAPSTNTGSSSLFRPTKYTLPTEEVRSFSLGDLLERAGIECCDLMKVDIEGAEYDVFMAATDVLQRGIIKNIALEYHNAILEKRGLSADKLHNQMVQNGYHLNTAPGPRIYSFHC